MPPFYYRRSRLISRCGNNDSRMIRGGFMAELMHVCTLSVIGETRTLPREPEIVVGFNPTREEPNSHPNLGSYGSIVFIGVGPPVKRPGTLNSSVACSACFFGSRNDKQRASSVRAAAADGDAAGL
jgi:hypothetical protein